LRRWNICLARGIRDWLVVHLCFDSLCLNTGTDANTDNNETTTQSWNRIRSQRTNHAGMVYIPVVGDDDFRLGHDVDNSIRYLFGTSFDDKHRDILEQDNGTSTGPDVDKDIADRESLKSIIRKHE
jgi:hypothetical protein